MALDERMSQRVRLRDLHMVLAVTQAGTMAKAAQALAVSPPVVSKAIGDLERTLGVKLFDRTPHGIEPTPYGRQVARWGVAVFDEMRQGAKQLEFLQDPTQGELKLGSDVTRMGGFVSEVIDRLTRKHPGIVIHADTGLFAPLRNALLERKLDMIVSRSMAGLEPAIEETPLFSDSMAIVVGVNNPLSRRRKLTLADVIDEPWISPPDGAPGAGPLAEACRVLSLPMPRKTVVTASGRLRHNLLASGRYLAVTSNSSLQFTGMRNGLKKLPIKLPLPEIPVCAMTLRQRTPPPSVKLFIEAAKQVAKEMGKPFV